MPSPQLQFKFVRRTRTPTSDCSRRSRKFARRFTQRRLQLTRSSLGSGLAGAIVTGREKIGNRHREVAVKVFHHSLSPKNLDHYRTVISKMRNVRLPLLKMRFTRYDRKWVLVMELVNDPMRRVDSIDLRTPKSAKAFSDLIIKIVNQGYAPAVDSLVAIQQKSKTRFAIQDIDLYFTQERNGPNDRYALKGMVDDLRHWMEQIVQGKTITKKGLLAEWKGRMANETAQKAIAMLELEA